MLARGRPLARGRLLLRAGGDWMGQQLWVKMTAGVRAPLWLPALAALLEVLRSLPLPASCANTCPLGLVVSPYRPLHALLPPGPQELGEL